MAHMELVGNTRCEVAQKLTQGQFLCQAAGSGELWGNSDGPFKMLVTYVGRLRHRSAVASRNHHHRLFNPTSHLVTCASHPTRYCLKLLCWQSSLPDREQSREIYAASDQRNLIVPNPLRMVNAFTKRRSRTYRGSCRRHDLKLAVFSNRFCSPTTRTCLSFNSRLPFFGL